MNKLEQLLHLTQHETKLFLDFTSALESMKPLIERKNWVELEKSLQSLKELGVVIEEQEGFRSDCFEELKSDLGVPQDHGLSDILPLLSLHYQKELGHWTRELKQAVIKVKVTSQGLGYYLKHICSFIHDFLGELFPHRKGKIYSRSGRVSHSNEDNSVMINQKL
ncbi:MAG: hypothetical protein JXR70_16400 [Spirochaetales bacterium]|nr:hypothetical protein [Spirochaetales bacterium]